MKTVWLKRGDRYESVRLLREYPEIGAVKVLRVGSPEPWTFKASEIVTEKPLTRRQREWIIKRQVREERETEQREQVKEVLFDGKPKSIMEIVDAVNAMPRAMTRMEPAETRGWLDALVRRSPRHSRNSSTRCVSVRDGGSFGSVVDTGCLVMVSKIQGLRSDGWEERLGASTGERQPFAL